VLKCCAPRAAAARTALLQQQHFCQGKLRWGHLHVLQALLR
jgi:hypothetical protein